MRWINGMMKYVIFTEKGGAEMGGVVTTYFNNATWNFAWDMKDAFAFGINGVSR